MIWHLNALCIKCSSFWRAQISACASLLAQCSHKIPDSHHWFYRFHAGRLSGFFQSCKKKGRVWNQKTISAQQSIHNDTDFCFWTTSSSSKTERIAELFFLIFTSKEQVMMRSAILVYACKNVTDVCVHYEKNMGVFVLQWSRLSHIYAIYKYIYTVY